MLLGSAYGKVVLDTTGVQKGVKSAQDQMQKLGQVGLKLGATMKSVGNTLTVGATLPILAMGAAAIKTASDFEETKNKAMVVFGDMSDSVIKNAEKADSALGLSAQKYLDYSSSIAAALKAGGMGVQKTAELSEQAVKHFADLASFHNGQVADVSAAWQSAIRGQYEPIQKYFPFINDAYMRTYGTAKGLIDATTKNLTANQRAIILNAIALDEQLNPALNDFAETSGGLANQTRVAQAQFENMLRTLGTNLLPIALQVVTALNKMLEGFNALPPSAQKGVLVMLGLAAALGPVLSALGSLIGLVSGVVTAWPTLVSGMAMLTPALASIGAVITGTVLPALAAFAATALTVILPIVIIIATLVLLYLAFKNNFMGITTTVKQLWFIIKYYFGKGWEWLVKSVQSGALKVRDWFMRLRDYIVRVFQFDWAALGRRIIQGIIIGIASQIASLITKVRGAAKAAYDAAKNFLGIKSPSQKFEYLGKMSGMGYTRGFANLVKPTEFARVVAQPAQQAASSQTSNSNVYNLPGGLSIRDVNKAIDQRLAVFGKQVVRGMK